MQTIAELSTNISSDINSDINAARELSLDELDNVNGGLLPLLAAVAVAFAVGYIAGADSCAC